MGKLLKGVVMARVLSWVALAAAGISALAAGEIDVTTHGVKPAKGVDNAPALQKLFDTAEPGTQLRFPPGVYEIGRSLCLNKRKNFTIKGERAELVRTDVVPGAGMLNGILVLKNCENCAVEGLVCRYADDTGYNGKFIATNADKNCAVIELAASKFTGKEQFLCVNFYDKNGYTFDEQYGVDNKLEYEKVNKKSLRLKNINPQIIEKLKPGMAVYLRKSLGEPPTAVIVSGGADIAFRDITFLNTYGMVFYVGERERNFTLERVTIAPTRKRKSTPLGGKTPLMSSNCDGLHVAGMMGKLTVKDCLFVGLGDDCVNVHSPAGIITQVSGSSADVVAGWNKMPLPAGIVQAGDTIEFFDPQTYQSRGLAKVVSVTETAIVFDKIPEAVTKDTIVADLAFCPQVEISGCVVDGNRARAFLLQTSHAVVKNCDIRGTRLAGVLIAPDMRYWYEVTPASDVAIENNTFRNCGRSAAGVVCLQASHDQTDIRGCVNNLHRGITIHGNKFINCEVPAVYATHSENVIITKNVFDSVGGAENLAIKARNAQKIDISHNILKTKILKLFDGENTLDVLLNGKLHK